MSMGQVKRLTPTDSVPAFLALSFLLGHAFKPVHGGGAVEEPDEFGVGLDEDFGFFRINSCA